MLKLRYFSRIDHFASHMACPPRPETGTGSGGVAGLSDPVKHVGRSETIESAH